MQNCHEFYCVFLFLDAKSILLCREISKSARDAAEFIIQEISKKEETPETVANFVPVKGKNYHFLINNDPEGIFLNHEFIVRFQQREDSIDTESFTTMMILEDGMNWFESTSKKLYRSSKFEIQARPADSYDEFEDISNIVIDSVISFDVGYFDLHNERVFLVIRGLLA